MCNDFKVTSKIEHINRINKKLIYIKKVSNIIRLFDVWIKLIKKAGDLAFMSKISTFVKTAD